MSSLQIKRTKSREVGQPVHSITAVGAELDSKKDPNVSALCDPSHQAKDRACSRAAARGGYVVHQDGFSSWTFSFLCNPLKQ